MWRTVCNLCLGPEVNTNCNFYSDITNIKAQSTDMVCKEKVSIKTVLGKQML